MNYTSQLIRLHAEANGLEPALVAAVILHESKADKFAYRIEENSALYRTIMARGRHELAGYVPPIGENPSLYDEKVMRATSFGWMQLLGETGRVLGFRGRYLLELSDPEVNLHWGCIYLAKCLKRAASYPQNERYKHALLFYNGGSDETYPAKVLQIYESGEAQRFLQL